MNNNKQGEESKRADRLIIVNEIIKEISKHDRRFFYSKGNVAELFIRGNKVFYKCEWVSEHRPVTEICLSVPDYRDLKGWFHGGTLRALVLDFKHFIQTGEYSNGKNGYGGLLCPYWGYTEAGQAAVVAKAKELGYIN